MRSRLFDRVKRMSRLPRGAQSKAAEVVHEEPLLPSGRGGECPIHAFVIAVCQSLVHRQRNVDVVADQRQLVRSQSTDANVASGTLEILSRKVVSPRSCMSRTSASASGAVGASSWPAPEATVISVRMPASSHDTPCVTPFHCLTSASMLPPLRSLQRSVAHPTPERRIARPGRPRDGAHRRRAP